jgi:hypothetical protein
VSIKRAKQRSFGSKDNDDAADFFAKPKTPDKTWAEWTEAASDAAFMAYVPATRFEKGALLTHSKFGKGAVVGVEGNKIEVLFQDGPKKLGHGAGT